MTYKGLFLIAIAGLLVAHCEANGQTRSVESVKTEFFRTYLALNPEDATELGYHLADGKFTDFSPAGIKKQKEFFSRMLLLLDQVCKEERLTENESLDIQMMLTLARHMLHSLREFRFLGNITLTAFPRKVLATQIVRADTIFSRWISIRDRIRGIPAFLDVQQQNLSKGKSVGKYPGKYSYDDVIGSIQETPTFFDDLHRTASHCLLKVTPEDPTKLLFLQTLKSACGIAADSYKRHLDWISRNVRPDSNFSYGRVRYLRHMREVFGIDETPEELVNTAWQELNGFMIQLSRLLNVVTPSDIGPAIRHLRSLQQSVPSDTGYYSLKDNVILHYDSLSAKYRTFLLAHHFIEFLDGKMGIIEMPVGMSASPPGANWPALLLDNNSTGYFTVNFKAGLPISMAPVLEVHEEGHYIQSRKWQEIFRKDTTPVRFFQISDESNVISGFWGQAINVEGYAHFLEGLMLRSAYYESNAERVEALSALALRAVRVIIDVGLHAQGMSVEEAAKLLYTYGMLETLDGARDQVTKRYALMPAQAMTYMVGRIQIEKLSEEWLKRNPSMTLSDFNRIFFSFGPVPPRMITKLMLHQPGNDIKTGAYGKSK